MSKRSLNLPGDTMQINLHFDWADKKYHIQHTQDVAPILDRNQALKTREHALPMEQGEGNFHHVATIPDVVIQMWKKEGIDVMKKEDWPKVVAKLNDLDFRKLKSTDKAI